MLAGKTKGKFDNLTYKCLLSKKRSTHITDLTTEKRRVNWKTRIAERGEEAKPKEASR